MELHQQMSTPKIPGYSLKLGQLPHRLSNSLSDNPISNEGDLKRKSWLHDSGIRVSGINWDNMTVSNDMKLSEVPPKRDTEQAVMDIQDGDLKQRDIRDLDPALQFMNAEEIEYTPDEAKKVLSKIDRVLMPLLCWVYLIQFADKTSLNYASLMGIREDTHLDPDSQQYSWVSSIFYAGYIFWE